MEASPRGVVPDSLIRRGCLLRHPFPDQARCASRQRSLFPDTGLSQTPSLSSHTLRELSAVSPREVPGEITLGSCTQTLSSAPTAPLCSLGLLHELSAPGKLCRPPSRSMNMLRGLSTTSHPKSFVTSKVLLLQSTLQWSICCFNIQLTKVGN